MQHKMLSHRTIINAETPNAYILDYSEIKQLVLHEPNIPEEQ